jgi:hypothetical protein
MTMIFLLSYQEAHKVPLILIGALLAPNCSQIGATFLADELYSRGIWPRRKVYPMGLVP